MEEKKLFSDEHLDTKQYKCPNCGGTSVFSPKDQKLKCEYCGTTFEINNNQTVNEHLIDELLNSSKNWTDAQVVRCESCGGKQIVNNNQISIICSFCGATNIVKTKELTGLAPHGIVPFKVEKNNCIEFVKKWAKRKFFAPNAFKKSVEPKNINGVYAPVFTFDAKTETKYNGSLYETYTTTHTDSQGHTHTSTHHKSFLISGNHKHTFDDLIINASFSSTEYNKGINDSFLLHLEPFPTNSAKQYDMQYLNGFSALTYSKDGKTCWNEGKQRMESLIQKSILSGYSYDGINFYSQNTKILSASFKFVLVPIYIGHYFYKQKQYFFYVNGSSGKVYGKTPASPIKITLFGLAIILIIAIFALLFNYLANLQTNIY